MRTLVSDLTRADTLLAFCVALVLHNQLSCVRWRSVSSSALFAAMFVVSFLMLRRLLIGRS